MKKICVLIVLILMIPLVAGCGKADGRAQAAGQAKEEVIPVKVMKVKLETIDKSLEYIGDIKGQNEAVVYPKVSGKIIEKVKENGSAVTKGEAIAYIDRDEVGLKFEKAPVESPLDGVVGRVYVDIGSSVTPETPIALVSNTDKAEIDLDMPESYLPSIAIGQAAAITVDAYPNDTFKGSVSRVSPIVDIQTRSAPIEISIDNADHRLQSGMFARVKLVLEEGRRVPVVMKESIIGKMADTYIYVVEDGRAVLRKVKLGIRHGPLYEVLEGVREGDMVVIMGQQRLGDGVKVAVEE